MHKRGLSLAVMLTLAGCASGPDYVRPDAPVPAQWPVTSKAPEAAKQVPVRSELPGWRAFYTDQRLQALIAQALDNNRDLRIATARIAETKALYGIRHAERLPAVELGTSRNASLTPADISGLGRQVSAQRYDVGANLLSFELDFWGRVSRLDEAALATFLSSEEARRAFRLSLIADVANAYFSQCELQERVRLAQASVDNSSELRGLAEQRRRVGLINDLDFLQIDAAAQAARADLASLELSRAAADNLLNLLLGMPSTTQQMPQGRRLDAQEIGIILVADVPSEVLLKRPDVLAAEQQLIAANANIGAARAAFLPRITLIGALGTASSSLSGLFKSGSSAWNFQPQLRLPLFDGGRNEANVDLAEARRNIAVAEYEKTLQQAFREVADLLAAREQLVGQLHALDARQRLIAERQILVEARQKAGVSSYQEVLDGRRDLLAAQQAVLQTRRTLLSGAAQLYKALGGGSENE